MRADNVTAQMNCPACGESLTIPLTLRVTDHTTASITFNTLAVQDHLKTHATAEDDDEEAPGERT